jgi:diaminopimelate dehydrogenase
MARLRLAVVGFGRLGHACAHAVRDAAELELAGVVRRPEAAAELPAPFRQVRVAAHLRDLGRVDGALLCVPSGAVAAVAHDVLQLHVPVVECAILEGRALVAHYEAIARAAAHHRVPAIVGAGWNPGMLPLLRRAFVVLISSGHTAVTARPGVSLHHTEAAAGIPGIEEALATEYRDAQGRITRYVHAQLEQGADPARVRTALEADPLFAGEQTLLFPVESIAALEEEGHGILLERRGTVHSGAHQNILLEARFDVPAFAARVMVDAARRLLLLGPGAHRYSLRGSPEGDFRGQA